MNSELEQIATTIREIALEAGNIPMRYFRAPLEIDMKQDNSPVTIADRETERFIRGKLAVSFPTHGIWGEEYGGGGAKHDKLWIIDPIDGTRSFISGHPLFGMLLGYLENDVAKIGLVNMPALGEIYLGIASQSASKNGTPIHCSTTERLEQATLYIQEVETLHQDYPQIFARLLQAGQTRRMAHDCYGYALLASGSADIVIDCGLQPYDYLPLIGLIQAAGGIISDWQGKPLDARSDGQVIACANAKLHEQMLELIAKP